MSKQKSPKYLDEAFVLECEELLKVFLQKHRIMARETYLRLERWGLHFDLQKK